MFMEKNKKGADPEERFASKIYSFCFGITSLALQDYFYFLFKYQGQKSSDGLIE